MDLDGDGRDELLQRVIAPGPIGEPGPASALLFFDDNGQVLDQTNYDGLALTPTVADVLGDPKPEVLVPLQRHDSMFISIASGTGQKLQGFLLMTGGPRQEPDGALPWDPQLMEAWITDVDGDGVRDLVSSVSTAYARMPRGVVVNRLPNGEEIGASFQGTGGPLARLFADLDGDGAPELLVATMRTRHGAKSPGFDDAHTYLLYYELTPRPRLVWSRETAGEAYPRLALGDFDGDGDQEVLFAEVQSGSRALELELLTPGSWTVERRRRIEGRFEDVLLVDLDGDERVEMLAHGQAGKLTVIDARLEPLRRVTLPGSIVPGAQADAWPDVDGDGVDEITYSTTSGFLMLSPDLRIKAIYPTGRVVGVEKRGLGRPGRVLIYVDGSTRLATLTPNPLGSFFRFGPLAAAILLVLAVGWGLARFRTWNDWRRLARATGPQGMESGWRTLAVVDRSGRILWRAPDWPGASGSDALKSLLHSAPLLHTFLESALSANPPRRQGSGDTGLLGQESSGGGIVTAEPLWIGSRRDPHWIIGCEAIPGAFRVGGVAWPMMAQRIAHSIKQPLTHMLLTVQRLQTEYREWAPGVAGRLDPYAERIGDGIEQLRRLTSSFLKLTDLAEPDLEVTDISRLISAFVDRRAAQIPPDIRLQASLAPGVSAHLDGEQLEVALDNLVANSVNAMDKGGTITISVTTAEGVRLPGTDAARDYVVIEVMDTGSGVPADIQERIFEAGFSTSGEGSGLGLAIVRKIVEDHEGCLSVESDSGVGSVFTLHFPKDGPVTAPGHDAPLLRRRYER